MTYILIGAVFVISLLTGFTALSVFLLSKRVSSELNAKSIQLLSPYDLILEDKAKELEKIREEINVLKQEAKNEPKLEKDIEKEKIEVNKVNILNTIEKINSTNYIDKETLKVYKKIKKNFIATPENVHKAMQIIPIKDFDERVNNLFESLSYETMYKLSTLPKNEQERILYESLDEYGKSLLKEYKEKKIKFSALGFYDDLKSKVSYEKDKTILYVSTDDSHRNYGSDVEIKINDSICEGFIIQNGTSIYDYSIRENENF